MKKSPGVKPPEIELESSLLAFAKVFKNHVLTDSRVILLCSHLYQEQNGEVEGAYDNGSDVDTESSTSLQMLAQLCGQASMPVCLEIFIDKIVQNLMSSANSDKSEEKRIVDQSLDVFNTFLVNHVSCKQLAALPIVKQLATAHINQFSILQGASQMKQLGQFFRVLCSLWVTEEFISSFPSYLEQLAPKIQ